MRNDITYRQTIPNKVTIIWFEVIIRASKSNSSHTNVKACPTTKLTL